MAVLDVDIGESGVVDAERPTANAALDALERAATLLQEADLDGLDAREELEVVRRLEVARRRIDHGTDRVAAHLESSQAFVADGLRSVRSALAHLGRLPTAESNARAQTVRALRLLPAVESAYARGAIPTAHVRAIARAALNPRVRDYLAFADPVFAEQASIEQHHPFCRWLRTWEQLADADGADQDSERTHERRHAEIVEEPGGGFSLSGSVGGLQGAVLAEVFARFVDAEEAADWAEARERLGHAATPHDLARTPRQRRADALVAIFRRAAGADGPGAVPLVNVVVDLATLEAELWRAGGGHGPSPSPRPSPSPTAVDGRRCHSLGGTPLHPSDAVAAALVGHLRRVVLDGAGNLIDLGRRRRLFTGSAREAALVQAALEGHDGLRCGWSGCLRRRHLQVDHVDPASRGGPTDVANSLPLCGFHNRLKEHGWRPVRGPDGRWTILRPDGSAVTPPA